MLLDDLGLLLGHGLVDGRHQSQELDAAFVGILSADFHSKLAPVESLELHNVFV